MMLAETRASAPLECSWSTKTRIDPQPQAVHTNVAQSSVPSPARTQRPTPTLTSEAAPAQCEGVCVASAAESSSQPSICDELVVVDSSDAWDAAQAEAHISSTRSKRLQRRRAMQCSVPALLDLAGYVPMPTHWRVGSRINLCAYLAAMLAAGEIAAAEAEAPSEEVGLWAAHLRGAAHQWLHDGLHKPQDSEAWRFARLALEATFDLDGKGGFERLRRDEAWLIEQHQAQALAREPQLCAMAALYKRRLIVAQDGGALGLMLIAYMPSLGELSAPCSRVTPDEAISMLRAEPPALLLLLDPESQHFSGCLPSGNAGQPPQRRAPLDDRGRHDTTPTQKVEAELNAEGSRMAQTQTNIHRTEMSDRQPAAQASTCRSLPPRLEVRENGEMLDLYEFERLGRHDFGRLGGQMCLEHLSCSRYHAQFLVEFDAACEKHSVSLRDCESAHGTRVDGERLLPWVPCRLWDRAIIQFGESSRQYIYRD